MMDPSLKFPTSPRTTIPLHPISPDRVNRQSENISPTHSRTNSRDSFVLDKISKFESVSKLDSLAYQGKALERKTADAALKRAMMGREEAEADMRRYRDEARTLRKTVEEGERRERRVGERVDELMEKYTRAKETHAHTQALWDKEIRRARKEAFKSQSALVKLQEELKAARSQLRITQGDISSERERSTKREQEAFEERYRVISIKEERDNALEKIKLLEQERDALKTIAKSEEIARIAADGQLPLPRIADGEFASPRKVTPIPKVDILSSAASEQEILSLREELAWHKRRAGHAFETVEFLELECKFKCCPCAHGDHGGQEPLTSSLESIRSAEQSAELSEQVISFDLAPQSSVVYIPSEGIFRTLEPAPEESPWISPAKQHSRPTPEALPELKNPIFIVPERAPRVEQTRVNQLREPQGVESRHQAESSSIYARTPSCEPPCAALPPDSRVSLASLLSYDPNAHAQDAVDDDTVTSSAVAASPEEQQDDETPHHIFHTISTTTRVPLALPSDSDNTPTMNSGLRSDNTTTVPLDPALSPTMTREEALAMIRERRGRARSLAQGTLTPRKQMADEGLRRDISAPAVRSGAIRGRQAAR